MNQSGWLAQQFRGASRDAGLMRRSVFSSNTFHCGRQLALLISMILA
jgi:hypothetical protein